MAPKKTGKKKQAKTYDRYPVLETVGKIRIRAVNYVSIMLDQRAMKKLARMMTDHPGISAAKLIAFSGKPCDCCKSKPVIVHHKEKFILVQRGLLPTNRKCIGGTIATKPKKS